MFGTSISATLIVRNEERFLDDCLASIREQVDEIVLVDTGSTDDTLEIARRYGVVLLHREWRDDFAWARNAGLDAASRDWILYIDADERLSLPEGRKLAEGLDDPRTISARVLFRPTLHGTPFREYRLFRRDPRIRFRGAMHETIMPDISRLEAEGSRIVDSDALLVHLGYEGDQEHKRARNLPLLRAAVAADPGRLYYWHDLTKTLADMGLTDEALELMTQVMPRLASGTCPDSERGPASLLALTHAELLRARGEDPMDAIELGLRVYPGHAQLLLHKARALVERDRPSEALPILEGLVAIDSSSFVDPVVSYDRRLFDELAPDMMGVALLRMGRRAEAADAFERAFRAAPDNLSYRAKAIAVRPR